MLADAAGTSDPPPPSSWPSVAPNGRQSLVREDAKGNWLIDVQELGRRAAGDRAFMRDLKKNAERMRLDAIRARLRSELRLGQNTTYVTPYASARPLASCSVSGSDDLVVPGFREPKKGRALRYDLHEALRSISLDRVAKCHHTFVGSHRKQGAASRGGGGAAVGRGPDIVMKKAATEGMAAYFDGLLRCGSAWSCPICGPTLRSELANRVQATKEAWEREHGAGSVLLASATFAHDEHHRYASLRDAQRSLGSAWRWLLRGETWKRIKRRFGLLEYGRAHDATHGRNGWHPHLHGLLFFERALSDDEREELSRVLSDRWSAAIAHELGNDHRPDAVHGFVLSRCYRGEYLAKLGLEVSDGGLGKQAKSGNRTPWQIAYDWARHRRPADGLLWLEYAEGMKGARLMTWSRGLKVEEPTIEEREQSQEQDEGQIVYSFDADTWGTIRSLRGGRANILAVAEGGGREAVKRRVAELVDWRRWKRERAATIETAPGFG